MTTCLPPVSPPITATERVERFAGVLDAYTPFGPKITLIDLLADARHWCDRHKEDFAKLDRRAYKRYLLGLTQAAAIESLDANAILESLVIASVTHREVGGFWVKGTIANHRFEALCFLKHAKNSNYELGQSRISKLWLREIVTKKVVANFDRGWDQRPSTDVAGIIVGLLETGLVNQIAYLLK